MGVKKEVISINWIDYLIIAVVIFFAFDSFRSGLISTLAQLVGLVLGLSLAAFYYPLGSNYLIERLEIATGPADVFSFVIIFMAAYVSIIILGSILKEAFKIKPLRIFDSVAGAVAGAGLGVVVSGALLFFMTIFPLFENFDLPMEESRFGLEAQQLVEGLYHSAESILPVNIPRLAFQPETAEFGGTESGLPDFRMIDFSQLDGSNCVDCGEEVEFKGYMDSKEGYSSPKYVCIGCERTSDGCQTYQGHHLLYEHCPAVLGRQGYRTDCGMWPNNNYVRVTGTCPVCGESGISGGR